MARQIPVAIELMRLHSRISKFYDSFNEKKWEACFKLLDPKLREDGFDKDAYIEFLSSFFKKYGPINIGKIDKLQVMHVSNKLYGNRPFAFGLVDWKDNQERLHLFRERWVKSYGTWYTCMIGLM